MTVDKAYCRSAGAIGWWSRWVESPTRRLQVADSASISGYRLIVSAPTDYGIGLLAAVGPGETTLLCFSEPAAKIARAYCSRKGLTRVRIEVAPFFRLPFADSAFAAVYANCFLDFCPDHDHAGILREFHRVLRPGGSFFTVNLAQDASFTARVWPGVLRFLSPACRDLHPVDPEILLSRYGFRIVESRIVRRCGFPMGYLRAVRGSGGIS